MKITLKNVDIIHETKLISRTKQIELQPTWRRPIINSENIDR